MNSSSTTPASDHLSNRRWSIALLLAVLIGLSSFSLASVPVWLVVVPLVLVAWMDFGSSLRSASGSGVSPEGAADGASAGASENAADQRPAGHSGRRPELRRASWKLAPLLFHGVVIATVVVAHHEVGKAGGGQQACGGRYVMARGDAGTSGCSGCGGGKGNGQSLATSATVRTAASGCGCGSGGKGGETKAMMAGVANAASGAPALRPPPVRSLNQIPGIDKPPGSQSRAATLSRATANVRSLNPIPGSSRLESLPHSGTFASPDARSDAAAVTKAPLRLPLPPTMAGKTGGANPLPDSSVGKDVPDPKNEPSPTARK